MTTHSKSKLIIEESHKNTVMQDKTKAARPPHTGSCKVRNKYHTPTRAPFTLRTNTTAPHQFQILISLTQCKSNT